MLLVSPTLKKKNGKLSLVSYYGFHMLFIFRFVWSTVRHNSDKNMPHSFVVVVFSEKWIIGSANRAAYRMTYLTLAYNLHEMWVWNTTMQKNAATTVSSVRPVTATCATMCVRIPRFKYEFMEEIGHCFVWLGYAVWTDSNQLLILHTKLHIFGNFVFSQPWHILWFWI